MSCVAFRHGHTLFFLLGDIYPGSESYTVYTASHRNILWVYPSQGHVSHEENQVHDKFDQNDRKHVEPASHGIGKLMTQPNPNRESS